MKKILSTFSLILALLILSGVSHAATVLIEDEFNDPAGDMPVNTPPNTNPTWRWNETGGLTKNAYDGSGNLLMPNNGLWDQYIDTPIPGGTPTGRHVTFIAIFKAKANANVAIGFAKDISW